MAELMAECADGVGYKGIASDHKLIGAGVAVEMHAIIYRGPGDVPGVWPYSVLASSCSLAPAGVKYKYVVDDSVVVVVELGEVNINVKYVAGIRNHLVWSAVTAVHVASVV